MVFVETEESYAPIPSTTTRNWHEICGIFPG